MKNELTGKNVGKLSGGFWFLSLISIFLCAAVSIAAQSEFASVGAFLEAQAGAASMAAQGDLDADGREDWAGVVERRKSDSETTSQLYVLLRTASGYRVAGKSIETETAGSGCCYVENLEIENGGVFIQNNAKSGDWHEAVTHQFKLVKGEWRLVGLKIYEIYLDKDETIETSVDFLTGAAIEKKQKGERRPIVKRKRRTFAKSLLENFDFSRKPFS